MKRAQLEHILRAAAQIIKYDDLLVIGSQSVLGSWDETRLPPEAVRSIEADIASLDGDEENYDFATALLTAALLDPKTLAERIELLGIPEREKDRIRGWLRGALAKKR